MSDVDVPALLEAAAEAIVTRGLCRGELARGFVSAEAAQKADDKAKDGVLPLGGEVYPWLEGAVLRQLSPIGALSYAAQRDLEDDNVKQAYAEACAVLRGPRRISWSVETWADTPDVTAADVSALFIQTAEAVRVKQAREC